MTDKTLIDASIIAEAKETMQSKFPVMVQYFLEDSENYIANIREGVSEKSADKIVSPAHTLKSSAKQMGAVLMSDIAKNIELKARELQSAQQNDVSMISDMLTELENSFAETKLVYHKYAA